jgi:large subunit ribosomal protein L5
MTERRSKREAAVDEPMAAADAVEQPMAAADAVEQPIPAESMTQEEGLAPDQPTEAPPVETPEAAKPEAETPEPAKPEAETPEPPVSPEARVEAAAEPGTEAEEADAGEPIAAAAAEPAADVEVPAEPAPERRSKGSEPKGEAEAPARQAGPRGLHLKYRTDVVPALAKQFEYANPNQVPRLQKIVVNIGLGEALTNAKAIDAASSDLTMITGQRPIVMKARRSIAQFKIRTGNPIGLKVTLRGQRMWDFLERMTMLALPRIRDFRGTPGRSFDGRGNYTLGMREQIAFPEIDYDKVDRLRGLEVSIVTTAKTDEESKRLLELLGMPFAS